MDNRVDTRGEWFREWDSYSLTINRIPRWYWLGMLLSACWVVVYLLVYPSLPGISSHWKGLGVPGGCQPWTAICEMKQKQLSLDQVRGKYLARIRDLSAAEIVVDHELSEFVLRAGKVAFADNCAGCHGSDGGGTKAGPSLNDSVWLHGATPQGIQGSIRNPAVHPFGLPARLDETSAKILASYTYRLP
ncbi:MAG: c-type cytochrome [Gallionella sp.]|nr:c-type cytochrome [Gallionella sp.]MDD4946985.1 c-type cytochrome [Gallionella sp.]MDD5612575.1 c-type cytochrome [Gallionella sp.]